MAETKQLVLVVEGTAALRPHWNTILSDYVEKIIRSFCGEEDPANSNWSPDSPIAELALVNFKFHGPFSSCLVQRSSWTKNMDAFLQWLSAVDFRDGGNICYAGIAEGLAEALMMFRCVHGSQNPERHCILISASNPYPLPTLVYNPPDYSGTRTRSNLSDAKTVAKSFLRSSVSLSVISPNQLSDLREIYNSARRNPSETDPTIEIVKNPNHLILISKDFMEALMTSSSDPLLGNPNVVNDDVATNVGPASQQTSIARYVKLWEGDLIIERQGNTLLITKLQGYRKMKASESLAKDWPSTLQVAKFIPEVEMINKKFSRKLDCIIFRAMNEHPNFLLRLREKKLSIVVKLPSQTLVLTVSSDKVHRLVALLLPQEVVKYKVRESMASGSSVK